MKLLRCVIAGAARKPHPLGVIQAVSHLDSNKSF